LDWSRLEANADFHRFVRQAIAFRKAHPTIARSRFWRDDVRWYGIGRERSLEPSSLALAWCLHGGSQSDDDLYVMINASPEALSFVIQERDPGDWLRVADTACESPDDFCEPGRETTLASSVYHTAPYSVVLLRSLRR
jgi:glycogen operon protein